MGRSPSPPPEDFGQDDVVLLFDTRSKRLLGYTPVSSLTDWGDLSRFGLKIVERASAKELYRMMREQVWLADEMDRLKASEANTENAGKPRPKSRKAPTPEQLVAFVESLPGYDPADYWPRNWRYLAAQHFHVSEVTVSKVANLLRKPNGR